MAGEPIPLPWPNVAEDPQPHRLEPGPKAALERVQVDLDALAKGSASQFRILYGTVGLAGTIDNTGSGGWTVARTGVGAYTITWTRAWASTNYIVTLSMGNLAVAVHVKQAGGINRTTTTFPVAGFQTATGAANDAGFDFIAIGAA